MYNKARTAIEPFAFERYRKEKIRQQIEAARPARLKIKSNLPAVNQELALKFMDAEESRNNKKSNNLLKDDRFKSLFTNPEFEIDKNADEYKMLTPVLSRLEKGKVKELKRKAAASLAYEDENEKAKSSDDDLFSEKDESEADISSDDDDRVWAKDLKKSYRQIRKENKIKDRAESDESGGDDVDDNDDRTNYANTPIKRDNFSNGSQPKLEFKVKNITTKVNKYVSSSIMLCLVSVQ